MTLPSSTATSPGSRESEAAPARALTISGVRKTFVTPEKTHVCQSVFTRSRKDWEVPAGVV